MAPLFTSLESYSVIGVKTPAKVFFLLPCNILVSFCVRWTYLQFVQVAGRLGQSFHDSCFKTKREIKKLRCRVSQITSTDT